MIPNPAMTLSLDDATALSQGSVWSEMGVLDKLEAILAEAVKEATATKKPITVSLRVEPQ